MNSERSALKLLRHVYREKGSTAFAIIRGRYIMERDAVQLILECVKCVKCGAEVGCFLDVCPVCGRISYLQLESNRVKASRKNKKAQARSGGRRNGK